MKSAVILSDMDKTVRVIQDRLYGQIRFSAEELKLFQTEELSRLRQISLSNHPAWITPAGECASRFEHTIGVAHLAKTVGKLKDFKTEKKNLYFASLVHDIGTPPFAHAGERYQVKVLGKNHEEVIEDLARNSELFRIITKQGGDVEEIIKYITGTSGSVVGELINGSIDLDNMDNLLRFGFSMGIFSEFYYSPEKIAKSFVLRKGKLGFSNSVAKQIKGWEKARKKVYDFVYSTPNLATGLILDRALDFAYRDNELIKEFFRYTDAQAFEYLATKCNKRTRTLMERSYRWIFYDKVAGFEYSEANEKEQRFLLEVFSRGEIADEISNQLKVPQEDVAVFMGEYKGYRKIHLKFLDNLGSEENYKHQNERKWILQVYVHPKWSNKSKVIKEIVKSNPNLPNE